MYLYAKCFKVIIYIIVFGKKKIPNFIATWFIMNIVWKISMNKCVIILDDLDLWPSRKEGCPVDACLPHPQPECAWPCFSCPKPTIHVQCVRWRTFWPRQSVCPSECVGRVWWVLEFKARCLQLSELDDTQRVEKIKDLLAPLPRCVLVAMRYLFAFLNQ